MQTRRALLASLAGGAAALAGCVGGPGTATDPNDSDTPTPGDRPTATPRDPRSLDASGTWRLRRADPAHSGRADRTGVPDDGTDYWHLRRMESGPAVVADGRLYHLAELSRQPERRTRTSTMTPGGTYIVRDGDPYLVARDAVTGELDWYVGLDGPAVGWPALTDGTVVAAAEGHLLAVGADGGEVVWERDLGETTLHEPTVAGDAVFVPGDGKVRAYELSDGSTRWTAPIDDFTEGVAVDGGVVYVTTAAGDAHAFDAESGEQLWEQATANEAAFPPTVAGDTLFVGGSAGNVAAHDAADGTELWNVEVGPNGWGGVAVAGDSVLYAGGQAVRALAREDGSERWAYEMSENYPVTPSVGDGVVYAGGRGPYEPELFALGLDSGERRWSMTLPRTTVEGDIVSGGLAAPPAVVDGGLYAYAVDGLYALGPA